MIAGVVLALWWVPRLEAQPAAENPAATESGSTEKSAPAGESGPPPAIALEDIVSVKPGATCLERDRLIDRVARWLQRTQVTIPLRVQVRGDSELATRVFFSVVTEPGEPAERRLDNAPSDCDQLHSAVALSIALAIEATLKHPGRADLPEIPEKAGWQRPPPEHPMHLEVAVLGGASVGVLTGASFAGSPRIAFSPWPWFSIAAVGLGTHVSDQTLNQLPGTYTSTLFAGGLDACFGGETVQGVGFSMCLGGRYGSFNSQGHYGENSKGGAKPWWALAGSGQGRFWLSGAVAIGTSVEALYALAERDITYEPKPGEEGPTVKRPVSQLGLSVTIGPVFRLF